MEKIKNFIKANGVTIIMFIASVFLTNNIYAAFIPILSPREYKQSPKASSLVKKYPNSATNTEMINIPSSFTYLFDSELEGQGACIKVKNRNGVGYTYLTFQDGIISSSQFSCE